MNDIVARVATAIAKVWSSENKNVDLKQAAILFESSARAAIEAMRETTDAMDYAADLLTHEIDGVSVPGLPEMIWEAMINEALK